MSAPEFINRDPETTAIAVAGTYTEALGKQLYPAQPEQLLVNGAAYREALLRLEIQNAAEQGLVNYATGDRLSELGALVGAERLPAAKARSLLKFSRTSAPSALLIPSGTRIAPSSSGEPLWFETEQNLTLPVGTLTAQIAAVAQENGAEYNGLTLNQFVDRPVGAGGLTVENITAPTGGAALETDERLRVRIKLAPGQFSVAGSREAYEFFTLSADSTIIDAVAVNAGPVQVSVYPLTASGLPSAEILTAVQTALSDDKVRPLTDVVRVFAPTRVEYALDAQITLYATADANALDDALLAAANAFVGLKAQSLGQDIVRSQLIDALSLAGVYRVDLISPAADIILSPSDWPQTTSVRVRVIGESDG